MCDAGACVGFVITNVSFLSMSARRMVPLLLGRVTVARASQLPCLLARRDGLDHARYRGCESSGVPRAGRDGVPPRHSPWRRRWRVGAALPAARGPWQPRHCLAR